MFKKLLSILLILSLTVAFCSVSLAEGTVKISQNGIDCLRFAGLLPDGRMAFAGCMEQGSNAGTKARLLCLNPDGTVSWEYVDQKATDYFESAVTDEGIIAVMQSGAVKVFSADGQFTGKEIHLDKPGGLPYEITSHGLLTEVREFTDWDGKTLFKQDDFLVFRVQSLIADEDGLVLTGWDSVLKGRETPAKMMKVDWQGTILWEKTLPMMTEEDCGRLEPIFRTGDGGYLALHTESVFHPDTEQLSFYAEVVKFSADGEILWTKRAADSGENPDMIFTDITEYDGKYAVLCRKQGQSFYPGTLLYLWLDADGKELGTIRRSISKGDVPELAAGRHVNARLGQLVVTKEGMWQSITFWDEELNKYNKTYDSMQQVLLPVPVL